MQNAKFLNPHPAVSLGRALALCLGLGVFGSTQAGDGKASIRTFDAPGAGKDGATFQGTVGIGINAFGTILGITRDKNDVRHGFLRLLNGAYVSFDHPQAGTGFAQGTRVNALNALGAVSGSYRDADGFDHPYIRDANGHFIDIQIPGMMGGNGGGINIAGAAAGNYVNLTDDNSMFVHYHGYVRSPAGAVTSFDPPNSVSTDVPNSALNDFGTIAGDYWVCAADFSTCTVHGFVRSANGAVTTFDVPGAGADGYSGQGTFPQGINNSGTITGFYVDENNVTHGFLRSKRGTVTSFDMPGACTGTPAADSCAYNGTYAFGINEWGAIVGQFYREDGIAHGFLREADGSIHALDVPRAGFQTLPQSINAWGQVAGYAYDPNFVVHGLLAKP